MGASLVSIKKVYWKQAKNPYEAAALLAKGNHFDIKSEKIHPRAIDENPTIIFRYRGGLLIGDADFDGWDDDEDNAFFYNNFRKYPKIVQQRGRVNPKGDFVYPYISDHELDVVRKKANRNEQGAYIETGETQGLGKHRIGQDKIRESALGRYGTKCALCDIANPSLLIAGHIKGWSEDEKARKEGSNVILMCALHDILFGKGLIGIHPKTRHVLYNESGLSGFLEEIQKITANMLRLVEVEPPAQKYLRWHLGNIFQGT